MLFLGIDTATRVGSVGLVRAPLDVGAAISTEPGRIGEGCTSLAEVSRETGLAHGAELLSLVDECLHAAGADLEDVAGIAVSSGPGSFTGLRVALATGKGLAFAGGIPLVGVPTLEALAATLLPGWALRDPAPSPPAADALIACCLDARKGELYAATFAVREPVWQDADARLRRLTPDAAQGPASFCSELRAALDDSPRQCLLIGDGAERHGDAFAESLGRSVTVLPFTQYPPHGATVARLGAALFAAHGVQAIGPLVPHYARASTAEIVRQQRSAKS